MAETFRAAVLVAPNRPLEIMELRFPELKDGQVLVRNIVSGICRSQLMEAKGKRGEDKWLPHLLRRLFTAPMAHSLHFSRLQSVLQQLPALPARCT